MAMLSTFITAPLEWQLKKLGLIFFGVVSVYLVGIAFYNLYLHPLSKHPGPLLGRITPLYALYHAWMERNYLHINDLHKKYGPVVRLAPNFILINDKGAIRSIYGVSKPVTKGRFYKNFNNDSGEGLFSGSDKIIHAKKRRVLAHVFTDPSLRGMQELYLPHIQRAFLEPTGFGKTHVPGVKEEWIADMGQLAIWMTFDIMFTLSFGESSNMLGGAQQHMPGIIDNITFRSLLLGTWLPLLTAGLEKVLFPHLTRDFKEFMKYSVVAAKSRMALPADARTDFFASLIKASDKEGSTVYGHDEMFAEARSFIIAGSDTTATQLAANLHYLAANPAAQEKLSREVRAVFETAEDIELGEKLDSCAYLHAIVDETLRMNPSVPGYFPREVDTPEGMTVETANGDLWVPQGAELAAPFYALHHDEKNFEKAGDWIPERWLTPEENGRVILEEGSILAGDRTAWWPFSYGSRGCIGKRLALIELYLALAMAAWKWEISFAEDGKHDKEYRMIDHLTASRVGPVVRMRERAM